MACQPLARGLAVKGSLWMRSKTTSLHAAYRANMILTGVVNANEDATPTGQSASII